MSMFRGSWSFKMSKFIIWLFKGISKMKVNHTTSKPMSASHLVRINPFHKIVTNNDLLSTIELDFKLRTEQTFP